MPSFEVIDLGLCAYESVWQKQKSWVQLRAEERIPDRLLLLEHEPVYTAGRKIKDLPPMPQDAPVYRIERGGELSFHEPGQLVAYPIFKLHKRDIQYFLTGLEEVLIQTLQEFGFQAERDARNTGVWISGRKVAAIGIAVRRWVTYHGFALNIQNPLTLAQGIRPCGFAPESVTSLAQMSASPPEIERVKEVLKLKMSQWWESEDA